MKFRCGKRNPNKSAPYISTPIISFFMSIKQDRQNERSKMQKNSFVTILPKSFCKTEKYESHGNHHRRKDEKIMTKIWDKTSNGNTDHSTFGGIIYPADFNTDHRKRHPIYGSSIANRIIQDLKFDEQCRRNSEYRQAARCEMQQLQDGADRTTPA